MIAIAAVLALQTQPFACLVTIEEEGTRMASYWVTGQGAAIQTRRLPGQAWVVQGGEFLSLGLSEPEGGTQILSMGGAKRTLGGGRFAATAWSPWRIQWIEDDRVSVGWTAERALPGDAHAWSRRVTLRRQGDAWNELDIYEALDEVERKELNEGAEETWKGESDRNRFGHEASPDPTDWAFGQADGLKIIDASLKRSQELPPITFQLRLPVDEAKQLKLTDLWRSVKSSGAMAVASSGEAGIALVIGSKSLLIREYDGRKIGRTLRSTMLAPKRAIQARLFMDNVEALDQKAPR